MKTLYTIAVVLVALGVSHVARADGFDCQSEDKTLNVKVYNHVDAEDGTRTGSVMILSDPAVRDGRKTIARFTDVNQTLKNKSSLYVAKVDLRFNDSGRKGELVAGTKLGELKKILFHVDFSYAYPVVDGAPLSGGIAFVKRDESVDGQVIGKKLDCVRYLKD